MPSKRSASGTSNDGSTDASGVPGDVIRAADELLTAAKSNAAPLTKKARQRIQKLGRQLEAARATEAKRLRQKAKAEQQVAKFDRLAADAAAAIVSLVGRIRDEARDAVGSGSGTSAAKPKAGATKPRSTAPKPKAPTAPRAKASAAAPATTRAKAKPTTATAATARKTATTARKPATPRKATTTRKTTTGTRRTTSTGRPGTRTRKPSA